MDRLLTGRQGGGVHDPGQFDFTLKRAVLVEIPIERVFVIPDGRDEGDGQPPRPAHLGLACAPIGVLPQNADVFFMQAHRVFKRRDPAAAVHLRKIEVMDHAQTVAAQRQRIGQHSQAVFADVEGVLAVILLARIAVGNHHLADRCTMQNGALHSLVVVADGVKHQAFARCETDPELPFLPLNLVAVDGEAGALRLHDVDGLQIRSRAGKVLARPIGGLGRERRGFRIPRSGALPFCRDPPRSPCCRWAARSRCRGARSERSIAPASCAGPDHPAFRCRTCRPTRVPPSPDPDPSHRASARRPETAGSGGRPAHTR